MKSTTSIFLARSSLVQAATDQQFIKAKLLDLLFVPNHATSHRSASPEMKRHRSDSISSESSADSHPRADGFSDSHGSDDGYESTHNAVHKHGARSDANDDDAWRRGKGPSKWTRLADDGLLNRDTSTAHDGPSANSDRARAPATADGWNWVCTLPPSCNKLTDHLGLGRATYGVEFESEQQLARHHERCHAWVCRAKAQRGRMGRGASNTDDTHSVPSGGNEQAATAAAAQASAPSNAAAPQKAVSALSETVLDELEDGEECGKIFPDRRMLELVSLLLPLAGW